MRLVGFAQFSTAVATGGLAIALIGAQNNAAIPQVVQNATAKVQSSVTRYEESHSLNDLAAAVVALDGTFEPHTLTAANLVNTRRTLARSWATILKEIESSYDPTYDPNDRKNVPFLCVPTPDVAGATPCMSPDKISDPNLRAQYIKDIEQNDRKKQRLEHYLEVKQLDERAMSTIEMNLKLFNDIAPDDIGPDAAALDSIFRSAGISAHRLDQLQEMIYAHDRLQKMQ